MQFDLLEFSDIKYNTTIFVISDYDGKYLTAETTLNNANQFTENSTFVGMMTSLTANFFIEVSLAEYHFILTTLTHGEASDFDLFLYGENEDGTIQLLDSMETRNIPEILGYDAYLDEIIWIEIVAHDGIGIFSMDILSGDGFNYHEEPGSWLGNPIEVSSSTSFTAPIYGPGFGGLTYYVVTLNTIADMQASFDLTDSNAETGGIATIYAIADDYLEPVGDGFPFSFFHQNFGLSKDYVILIIQPLIGETTYSLDIIINSQYVAPVAQIALGALAISLIVLKVKKKKKMGQIK